MLIGEHKILLDFVSTFSFSRKLYVQQSVEEVLVPIIFRKSIQSPIKFYWRLKEIKRNAKRNAQLFHDSQLFVVRCIILMKT
jgi:hypothetical protein